MGHGEAVDVQHPPPSIVQITCHMSLSLPLIPFLMDGPMRPLNCPFSSCLPLSWGPQATSHAPSPLPFLPQKRPKASPPIPHIMLELTPLRCRDFTAAFGGKGVHAWGWRDRWRVDGGLTSGWGTVRLMTSNTLLQHAHHVACKLHATCPSPSDSFLRGPMRPLTCPSPYVTIKRP